MVKNRIIAALTAVGVSFTAAAVASADTSCSDVGHGAQECQVYSESMDKDISVIIRPAHTDTSKTIQFLDGMNVVGDLNGWVRNGRALEHLEDVDATLVFPAGDSSTFYTDWDSGDLNYKTFMTEELPTYLETEFDVPDGGVGNTGVTGLSMGAFGALSLAAQRPDMYSSVLALSGFYDPNMPVQRIVTDVVPTINPDIGERPWKTQESRDVANPTVNLDKLTMPVTVTVSSGITNFAGDMGPDPIATVVNGGPLETGSLVFTSELQAHTLFHGKTNFRFEYDIIGSHAWDTWNRAAWNRGLMKQMIAQA